MACSACGKRKTSGRVVPVNPNPRKVKDAKSDRLSATAQGAKVRGNLRYTGR